MLILILLLFICKSIFYYFYFSPMLPDFWMCLYYLLKATPWWPPELTFRFMTNVFVRFFTTRDHGLGLDYLLENLVVITIIWSWRIK